MSDLPEANLAATVIHFGVSAERPTARYVSATTVREEALDGTRLAGLYWSASGQVQPKAVTAGLPGLYPLTYPTHVFELEIDGQSLHNRWEWVGAAERDSARPGTREAVVELRHQVRPVSVKVVTRLDGTPFLVRYLEITNTGSQPAALASVSPWSGLLWNAEVHDLEVLRPGQAPFTLGYFDGTMGGTEGNFVWEPLPRDTRRIESLRGHSGFGNPYFVARNEITGECAVGALAWSGNWFMEFRRDPNLEPPGCVEWSENLAFRMGPLGPAPQRVIAPGETVTSPEMHLGIVHCGQEELTQAWHEHLRASVIPPRPAGKTHFVAAGQVVEEPGEWILREIDLAADLGVEAFLLDAGWYGEEFGGWWDRRGDWDQVGSWIPGGLAAARERAHTRGLLFGLWMEPEGMGPKSRLLREHPEWRLKTDGERVIGDEHAPVLDLAQPEAARFLTYSILQVIREHQLDFFKIDYNMRVWEGGQHLRDGYAESELWRHYEVLYAAFDQVRRELPEVVLETCSSGGGRNDLGMLSRLHYCCESDFSQFPRGLRAINGLTRFLPPEAVGWYPSMAGAHLKTGLETDLRVMLFAQTTFIGFGAQDADRNTEYFRQVQRYLRLAREFTGPILGGRPRVFHHTPHVGVLGPADWVVLEYAARDRSAGYVGLFRLNGEAPETWLLRPRGLDPARRYAVTLDNLGQTLEMDGAELRLRGLPLHLDAAYTSELVLYRALD